MKRRLGSLALLFSIGCSSELPHDAPFDTQAPLEEQARAEVRGTVTLAGETDYAQISLKLQNDARTYTFDTESDGAVRLTGVVPGRYRLRAAARYFESVTADVTVTLGERYDLGSLVLSPRQAPVAGKATAEFLTGKAVVSAGGVVVALKREGSIRGVKAAAPAFAPAASGVEAEFTTVSGADGAYVFPAVPAGVYRLEASQGALEPITVAAIKVTGEDGGVTVSPVVLATVGGFIEAVGTAKGVDSAVYSQTAAIRLKLTATHAARVRLGSARGTDRDLCVPGAAQAFATTAVLTLAQEGPHVLCAVFVAEDGRESAPAYADMIFDATPPAVAMVTVNGGAAYTREQPLSLVLSSVDATAGVEKMVVATNAAFTGAAPQDYVPVLAYPAPGDGVKTLYVKFIDRAGNEKVAYPATITVDTAAPTLASFALQDAAGNSLAAAVPTTRVYLALGAVEGNPGLQLMAAASPDFAGAGWQPFQTFLGWDLVPSSLPAGADRTVYVRLRDAAGNLSLTGSQTVRVDTVAPTSPQLSFAAASVSSATVTVNLSAAGADWAELATDPSFAGANRFAYAPVTSYTFTGGDGVRTLYARYLDAAGNVSALAAASLTLDRAGPQIASLTVNAGNPYVTASVPVAFQLAAWSAGDSLQIADNAAFTAATSFAANAGGNAVAYTLAGPDGAKTLYLRGVDALGNVGGTFTAAVTRDTVAPTVIGPNALFVAGDAPYATSRFVSVGLYVAGASEMLLAEDSGFAGAAWEPFAVETLWTLSTGDAPKTLYAKFRDAAGNTIGAYADGIVLDTQAPANPSVAINAGAAYATTTAVTLSLSAAGATRMQLSNDGVFDTEPVQAYAFGANAWTLASGDGVKAVYVRYLDGAGNSSPVASAFILLDTRAPVVSAGSLVIDGGADYTNDPSGGVTLTLNAAEAVDVYLSEGTCGTGGVWSAYTPTHLFTTTLTEGAKTLYAVFRDTAGNLSGCASDGIIRDTAVDSPALTAEVTGWEAIPGRTANQQITLTLTGLSADVADMMVANDASYAGAGWVPVAASSAWFLTPGDGLKTVHVKVRDAAGNEKNALTSASATPAITLDQTPPATPALSVADVNNDGSALSSTSVELRWTVPAGVDILALQRRLVGLENDYHSIATPSPAIATYIDAVTAPGYTHSYRIRATDDLGNTSDWSLPADAMPYLPVSAATWIRSGHTTHYEFPPNPGTFLLSGSSLSEDSQGVLSTNVFPTNLVSWERPIPASDIFAEKLRVRTQNQDSSLVLESLFGIGYNERGAIAVSPQPYPYAAALSLVLDSKNVEHLLYVGNPSTGGSRIYVSSRTGGVWATPTKLANDGGYGHIDLAKDDADHLFAAYTLGWPLPGLVVARNDGLVLRDTFEAPFGTSNWSDVTGAKRSALAVAPPSVTTAVNLDGGGAVLQSVGLPLGVTLHYSYGYERQGLGSAPTGSDALYFEYFDGVTWNTLQAYGPADGSSTSFTHVTGDLPADAQLVRFRSSGSGAGTGDWFVDDVRVNADDGVWVSAQVDPTSSVYDAHLAVDHQGGIHVSYVVNGSPNSTVRYAGWVTGAWEVRDIGQTNLNNSHDVAVNSLGEPSIVFWFGGAQHAYKSGGVWNSEWIPAGIWPSIAFDRFDTLHVTTRNGVALTYAYGTPGAWSSLTNLESDGSISDLVADDAGKIHVAFARSSGALWSGSNETGSWVSRAVGSGDATYNMSIQRNDMGRDEIAYFDQNTATLRLVSYAPTEWQPWRDEVVRSAGDTGAYPSVTTTTGKWGVAYVDYTLPGILFSERSFAGWTTSVVEGTSNTQCLGAAYTTDGKAHLVYDDAGAQTIKYATNETGAWVVTVLESNAYQKCTLKVDSLNRLHAVYFGNPDLLIHRMRVNGVWQPAEVVATGFIAYDMDMAVDKSNNVHVFFPTNKLTYVNNVGGSWNAPQAIGPYYCGGCKYALAIDGQGHAHAFDVVAKGFRHWSNASGAWVSEIVDGDGGGVSGLAPIFDQNGKLHVFYGRQFALRYSTNLSGRWVSSELVREGYAVGSQNSVAIDALGRFHVAYRYDPIYWPGDGDLRVSSGYFSGVLPLLDIHQTSPF
jgi:hypothetical protein